MLHIIAILATLGITSVSIGLPQDPETEEEFTTNFTIGGSVTWEQYVAARETYFHTLGLKRIRQYRDKLLTETDWVDTPYSQSSLANLEEWNAHRQYLRDLPSQIDKLIWDKGMPVYSSLGIPPIPNTIRKTTAGSTGPTGTTEPDAATGPTGTA